MEIFYECNEKPMCDDKALETKMIKIDQPTFDDTKICANACMKNCNHIQAWFKCNHTMCIESAKHCGYCIECGEAEKKVVIRVKSTRIKQLELLNKKNKQLEEKNKQLEEKNKQLEMELEKMTKRKQVFLEGYKNTLEQLDIERIDWRGKSNKN